jgi:hypothetical protein
MRALAEALDVDPSHLANIQNGKRSASRELVKKITDLASGVNGSEILYATAVDTVVESKPEAHLSIGQRLKQDYDAQIQKLREANENPAANIENIHRNFDAMGNGDVFVYLTVATPPEEMGLYDVELKQTIANALQRGAYFVYVTPTREYLQEMDTVVDFPGLFASFKKKVMLNISNVESVQNEYGQKLLHIQTAPLFPLLDSKWELFLSDTFDNPYPYKAAAAALIVTGPPTSSNRYPGVRTPLSDPATKSFIFGMAKVVSNPGTNGSDQIPDVIVERLQVSVGLAKRT